MTQKQYRKQGDPKRGGSQDEGEEQAATELPRIDDLMAAAQQALELSKALEKERQRALAAKLNRQNGMPCPICCERGCGWPRQATPERFAEAVLESVCYPESLKRSYFDEI